MTVFIQLRFSLEDMHMAEQLSLHQTQSEAWEWSTSIFDTDGIGTNGGTSFQSHSRVHAGPHGFCVQQVWLPIEHAFSLVYGICYSCSLVPV